VLARAFFITLSISRRLPAGNEGSARLRGERSASVGRTVGGGDGGGGCCCG